ncbi:MAG TPA: MMPL family transporter [Solirubrobacterales bacterium]|jgi:RND superfamily putative drug exporter|nr:MMPL family transporter [Solirubrobacterales bacterium]
MALAIALVPVAVLVYLGFGLGERLTPGTLDIGGTPVHRANNLLGHYFGDSAPFVVFLRGKPDAIDRQGPHLVRVLNRDPRVSTLSPWDRGSVERLRPRPGEALIVVDFHVGLDEAVDRTVPRLERTLEQSVHPPVRAVQSSFATLSRSVQDESIAAAERGELIALPILLLVLLLVFRSPVAAAIPLGFGALAVFCSRGLLAVATNFFDVSALALNVCSMMGLALGVDYALLMVSRFREELAAGADPLTAARVTRRTAGRTAIFAGSTLVLSMIVAFFVVPGALLASLAGTLAMVVVLTVLVATMLGPPVLFLLGRNIDRWRIGRAVDERSSPLMKVINGALRHPAAVAGLIGGLVLLLATPALALRTGPFSIDQLPAGNSARLDAETIQGSFAGFEAPFTIVVAVPDGTIADPPRLALLSRWQRRIAGQPGVESVVGPEQVARAVAPLRRTGSSLLAANDDGPLAGFRRLGNNLRQAAGGIAALRGGLAEATSGAGLLAAGSGGGEVAATRLGSGLERAAGGVGEAAAALDRFATGTRRLAGAQARAANAALLLKLNLPNVGVNLRLNGLPRALEVQRSLSAAAATSVPDLQETATAGTEQLVAARQYLEGMSAGRSDPNFDPALSAVREAEATIGGPDASGGEALVPGRDSLSVGLESLREQLLADAEETLEVVRWIESTDAQISGLSTLARRLSDGLMRVKAAGARLAAGATALDRRARSLSEGLDRLGLGASSLATGLARLYGGTAQLQRTLDDAYSRSQPLQAGTQTMQARVISQNGAIGRRLGAVRRSSPGLFDSGYFVLSALDGARGDVRERASEAVDLDSGGQAATITVFSRYPFNSDGSIRLGRRLEADAAAIARQAGAETGVAGGPPTLNTYSQVTKSRMPIVIAAITIATFLVLVAILRAVPLAAIAVGLNLATVAIAFGVLTLLTYLPQGWPLGGREYVDAVGATMIFGIVFGLSIDYAVFLLVRTREHYDRHGDHAAAIEFGLQRTARVITGAAAIMMAVFIAYAGAPVATVSQLGIGLTVAVLLDATVVRIVLLPALMLLVGKKVWWLPRPLSRLLPRFEA